ncbi:Transcription factor 25 [Termitomyces sp. T112]|nr:Transcription factor 25 [Termitomyces sp. T112]
MGLESFSEPDPDDFLLDMDNEEKQNEDEDEDEDEERDEYFDTRLPSASTSTSSASTSEDVDMEEDSVDPVTPSSNARFTIVPPPPPPKMRDDDDGKEIKHEMFDGDDNIEDDWVDPSVPTPISSVPSSMHVPPPAAPAAPTYVRAHTSLRMHNKTNPKGRKEVPLESRPKSATTTAAGTLPFFCHGWGVSAAAGASATPYVERDDGRKEDAYDSCEGWREVPRPSCGHAYSSSTNIEYAQAVDFVDRALFTYERAFIAAFTFTTGTNRLDFDRVENRPFFLAIHRQISDLSRRGCTRTAFEFSRLLYGLDPHSDPHGAVFHLDLLAVKGGMGEWLVDLFEYHDQVREGKEQEECGKGMWGTWGKGGKAKEMRKMDPSLLPGWAYARALVLRVAEGDKANDTLPSAKALEEAIRSFPEVVPLLADKLEVALPGYIRSHESFRVNTDAGTLPPSHAALHALAHMYTAHSSAPWKDPSYSFLPSWFLSSTTSLFPTPASLPSSSSLPSTPRRTALLFLLSDTKVQRMLVRHVMVLEGTHRRFLPKDILMGGQGGAGGAGLACDPVPLGTGVNRYDDVYFEGVEDAFAWSERGRGRGGAVDEEDERMLEAVIRDREVRMRVLQFLRGLRAQFPGGLGEMLERIGPEAVEDVLGQVQGSIVGDEEAGGMPGAFAAAAVDEGGGAAVEGQGERVPVVEPEPRREVVPTQEEEGDEDEDEHRDISERSGKILEWCCGLNHQYGNRIRDEKFLQSTPGTYICFVLQAATTSGVLELSLSCSFCPKRLRRQPVHFFIKCNRMPNPRRASSVS